MKTPVDPDTIDWEQYRKNAIQHSVDKGLASSVEEAKKFDWDAVFSNIRNEKEKEWIEYVRHQELLTAIGATIPVR
jgi:hypothetical protein